MKYIGKLIFCVLAIGILCGPALYPENAAAGQEQGKALKLTSKIVEVTVFSDRAQITRVAVKRLAKGSYRLRFDALPDFVEKNSIQVSGNNNVLIRDVKCNSIFLDEIPDRELKLLVEKDELLTEKIAELEDKVEQAKSEKGLVKKIAQYLTTRPQNSDAVEMDPGKWGKMVVFYRSKLETIAKEIRGLNKAIEKLEADQSVHEELLLDTEEMQDIEKQQVEIRAVIKREGRFEFKLTYIIPGAKWYPVYDIRSAAGEKKIKLKYNAVIRQQTGEDWRDVKVKLSTAKPAIGAQHPDLTPWYLAFEKDKVVSEKKEVLETRNTWEVLNLVPGMITDLPSSKKKRRDEDEAVLESKSTSVVFAIQGKNTIKSDNTRHNVTIMAEEFPAHFRYSAIPKLSSYAYLKAQIQNITDYPILPGKAGVFFDNAFIAESKLEFVAPGEKIWVFLGVDEGIKIDYKMIESYNKNKGIIKKKNKHIYQRVISVKNNKKTEQEIVIFDQLPIPKDELIKVELMEPKNNYKGIQLKINDFSVLEWFTTLKPGREIRIPLKFSVEYPQDRKIPNL